MSAPAVPRKLAGRYEIRQVLGEGGMGLVYRAYDAVIRREVALKTIRDIPEPAALQLFQKECDVLASMSHPNIVEIFDIGELEEDGKRKPYFVMPLLPGATLDNIIRNASHRLTVERTVEIISQACRGLQAAHERGLVHRDLKPSNIFVMEDDSVKIIDFGVAHISDAHSTMGQKGTLLYMSPEQIEMKPLSALSDIFSLSVVCYEVLTGRQPFRRAKQEEIVEAILHQTPPPAAELNASVNDSISRVVHKGMAKQPWHRFSTARDFADTLNKALRNEPIEFFDPARIRPRLQRATKALEDGDYQFTAEIIGELEAEGHIDSSLGLLREQLDRCVRQKSIKQLLDAAKARFEEEEDPLALQKIQEVLQLDPENSIALSLKRKIESRRSERQIENWYRLASQHVQNHAYHHAREALQNVLQLKPKESRALQLMAEIDRQEQEYNKLRQEKVQLHRAAMDAWKNGEVSSALTKLGMVLELDRRAPDSANPERSASYQSFYNQVRSEHDAINSGYAEARKHLGERNFVKAAAVCDNFLIKYPNHALFQALKFDVEEQQRQELSSYIASVDRRVEAEPDLDKKVNVLREALALYPGEAHFERALQLVQDKRDLVNSIVAKAHLHEEQGAFADALTDWEILRTIYSQYPGLKYEIERLHKRREQQSRIEAKARWVEKIDECRHTSDYARALELVQQAEAEFPNDAELEELENAVRSGMKNATAVHGLVTEGEELCAANRFSDGIALLRQAFALDENSPSARSALSDALVEEARLLLDTNWHEAEELVQQALDLNPGHTLAKSMRTLILDKKREQFVDGCVSRARRLQAAADFAAALTQVDEGLASFPQEPRLLQLRETLRREMAESQRRRQLEELKKLGREAERSGDPAARQAFGERAGSMATTYAGDAQFLSAIQEVERLVTPPPGAPPAASAPAPSQSSELPRATMIFSPRSGSPAPEAPRGPASSAGGTAATAPKLAPRPPAAPRPQLVKSVSRTAPQVLRGLGEMLAKVRSHPALRSLEETIRNLPRRTKIIVGASALGLLVLLALIVALIPGSPKPPVKPAIISVPVSIHTSPPGATIVIDGEVRGTSDLQIDLPPGRHDIEARLPGYESAASSVEVKDGSSPVDLVLIAVAPAVKVIADAGTGKVWLDDRPPASLEDAQWSMEKMPPGEHTLKFAGDEGKAAFTFRNNPAAPPAVEGPVAATGLHAIVVSSMGGRVRVNCSYCPAKLRLDDGDAVDISADGLELQNIAAGTHKLSLTKGDDQHTLNFDIGGAPALTAFLESEGNLGSLLIVTGEDKVQIFLNGQPYKFTTKAGQVRIPNLAPNDYSVRVSKPGHPEVAEQRVQVRKGEQSRLVFVLLPAVQAVASLSVQGGTPGSEVLVDQVAAGTVQADGSFHLPKVSPGEHTIEFRKEGFTSRRLQKHFNPGTEIALLAADASLESASGQLRIAFSPPEADVTLSAAGGAPIKLVSGNLLNLSPGTYTLTARIAGKFPRTGTIDIVAGKHKELNLALAPGGMEEWEIPAGGWRPEKNWFVRRGGGIVLYRPSPAAGTFVFSAMLQKGHRLQWLLDYVDDGNYVLFQMDENFFYRSQLKDGKVVDEQKVPRKTDKKQFRTLQVVVTPNLITHYLWDGNTWVSLDAFSLSGTNLAAGKFGFLISNNDEVALSNFNYYGELKIR